MKFIFSARRAPRRLEYNQRFRMSTLAEIGTTHVAPFARAPLSVLGRCWLSRRLLAARLAMPTMRRVLLFPNSTADLQVSGSRPPVTVTRDGHGVPTIDAASLEDLFFAQGYVTAQDRLWQMDVMRRFGGGELSEILGEETLKLDREQRILGLRAAAKKSLAMASPRDRAFFEAYARGVNATSGAWRPPADRVSHSALLAQAVDAGGFDRHRQPDGEGPELSLLLRRARAARRFWPSWGRS